MSLFLAGICAGAATWLWLARGRPWRPGRVGRLTLGARALPIGVVIGWVTVIWLGARGLALGLLLAAAVAGMGQLVRRDRARRRAAELRRDVVEICETLAGEFRAGLAPVAALRHVADQWAVLEPVAAAAELGGDVPQALRQLAARPGAESLGQVAAAWQVSQRTGARLATALERCALVAREDRATSELVASELASAQATARLLAVLPVVVLTLGRSMGVDPWDFLLSTWPGIGCLAGGLLLAWLGLTWVERLGERTAR